MKKYICALLAIVISSQAYCQVVDDAPARKPSHHYKNVVQHQKISPHPQAEEPLPLPVLSKASAGFCTAINFARNPNFDMMDIYMQQGADVNAICNSDTHATALYESLSYYDFNRNNFELADWLIQHGADINTPAAMGDVHGVTLPMSLTMNITPLGVDQKTLGYLIQHGANFHAVDSAGHTALHWFRQWQMMDSHATNVGDVSGPTIAFFDQLINQGIDINLQDKTGTTALMNAVQVCSSGAVKYLLSRGADPALKNKLGKTSLDIAIELATSQGQGNPCNEVVKILYNPQQISKSFSVNPGAANNSTGGNLGLQVGGGSVGTYGGTYSGADEGVFQADIHQDGKATFHAHSNKIGMTYTHDGHVNPDGSISFASLDGAVVFTGTVSRNGIFSGTWKNSATNESGSFQGERDAQVAIPGSNLLKALGSLFK